MNDLTGCRDVTRARTVDFRVVVGVNSCGIVEIFIVNNSNIWIPINIDPSGENKFFNPWLAFETQIAGLIDKVIRIAGWLQVLIAFIFH